MRRPGDGRSARRDAIVIGRPVRYDVDFSLAIRNRTGKYVIGRQILTDQADRIDKVYYWRVPLRQPPEGRLARALDLAVNVELRGRRLAGRALLPPMRPRRPVLHLDPLTVLTARLRRDDIVLVHDIGPISHPALFAPAVTTLYAQVFRQIAAAAPRLVFVSRASRDGYLAAFGAVPDARVIYPPLREAVTGIESDPVPGIDGPFLLTVGSIGDRKNQRRCIEAFARSGLAARGVRYVLCGAREPGAAQVEAAAKATPGVLLLSFVTDRQLAWLYAQARGFVLMSLLEGFGMPVAEAIARGLVPLVARDTVLEEVAGPGALTAANEDVAAIAGAMTRLVEMGDEERAERRITLRRAITGMNDEAFSASWRDALHAGAG